MKSDNQESAGNPTGLLTILSIVAILVLSIVLRSPMGWSQTTSSKPTAIIFLEPEVKSGTEQTRPDLSTSMDLEEKESPFLENSQVWTPKPDSGIFFHVQAPTGYAVSVSLANLRSFENVLGINRTVKNKLVNIIFIKNDNLRSVTRLRENLTLMIPITSFPTFDVDVYATWCYLGGGTEKECMGWAIAALDSSMGIPYTQYKSETESSPYLIIPEEKYNDLMEALKGTRRVVICNLNGNLYEPTPIISTTD